MLTLSLLFLICLITAPPSIEWKPSQTMTPIPEARNCTQFCPCPHKGWEEVSLLQPESITVVCPWPGQISGLLVSLMASSKEVSSAVFSYWRNQLTIFKDKGRASTVGCGVLGTLSL